MTVETHQFDLSTSGHSQVLDLSEPLNACLQRSAVRSGLVTVFVVGSTAAITTTEFEPGLAQHDLAAFFERLAPEDGLYRHEQTWGDDNGHSHLRASLLGPSLTVPLVEGRLTLGQWQQVVLLDFDTRPRTRRIIVQILGA